MASYLDRILEVTRERLEEQRRRRSPGDLEREAAQRGAPRDFLAAMMAPGISLVAEVKRRSPSAGAIRMEIDPAGWAGAYQRGGARALSVLTEPVFFSGSLQDLKQAREACALPVLRKDFVLDPYQVVEARAAGADAVLIIVAATGERGLYEDLMAAAAEVGLLPLVEIHDRAELDLAFEANPVLIGVNQRNLHTFGVDRGLAARLRRSIPSEVAVIAESGIGSRGDVEALEAAHVQGVLVGETLMRSEDPERAVAELLGRRTEAR
ncbi:MAG: indole-3-glycerol phosphate synthase TrpC [Actinomycetota bacterium]